jgi:ABC-2 type transport system permease protein
MQPSERAAGNLYDLGYRNYDGPRLGRGYAFVSLYLHSVRNAFALGRRTASKILPFALAIIAFLPATIQLGIAALVPGDFEVYRAENYYAYIQTVLALFCAAVAPELVCRDQANRTLSLYFSRSLVRRDYALGRLAGLATALLVLTLGPQLLLIIGNGLAARDAVQYIQDNYTDILPIVASGAMISVFIGSIGLAIASHTSRRAYAAVAVVAFFLVTTPIVGITLEVSDPGFVQNIVYISPLHVMQGLTYWLFRAEPGGDILAADRPGETYLLAVVIIVGIALWVLDRRYQRIAA